MLQPPYPSPVLVVVETIDPTAFSPLSCGSFAYHPRLGHRVRPWTLSSHTSLVVDIKESTTQAANLVVLPSRLTLHLPFCVLVCLPRFGCLLTICVVPPPKKKTINVYPTGVLPTPLLTQPPSHPTPFYPTPCYPTHIGLCAVHPTPRQHPCYPPTMSHKPFSPLYPIITPTLHDHPRTNLRGLLLLLYRMKYAIRMG